MRGSLGRRASIMVALATALLCSPALAEAESTMTKIHVTVGTETLTATLDDTAAGRDFARLLPLELPLSDYHGIEKIADLPRKLDTTGAPAKYAASAGDITLYAPWGNLAIFYKPFPASAGLVRLGAFDGSLAPLLQAGKDPVRFELAD